MTAPRVAPIPWPVWLSLGGAFLPPIAAAWNRRSFRREPAGQVAFCWLVMSIAGVVSMLQFMHLVPRTFPLAATVGLLFPLLLVPPTLTWIGPAAKRRQPLVLGAWIAVCAVLVVAIDDRRELRLVSGPLSATVLAILSVAALGARARSAVGALQRQDWLWILTAHVMYFGAEMLRPPLMETLSGRLDLGRLLQEGFLVVQLLVYVLLAWGMLQPPATAR
jgi:hypothetical protein